MEKLNILRLEINYFLSIITLALGYEDKYLAEEALDMLTTFYLFNHNEEFCIDYICRLELYINEISKLEDLEYKLLKRNIPTVINFINEIKYELE